MMRITHGYGVLQEQTSQENKKKLKLLTKTEQLRKKCIFLAS